MIHIPTEKLADFEKNIRREWTMTNGIGGYAGGSIIGACNRTHQGYLIASTVSYTHLFLLSVSHYIFARLMFYLLYLCLLYTSRCV